MKIVIDARSANLNVGIGRLSYNLIKEILKNDRENSYIILTDSEDPFPKIKYDNIKKISIQNAREKSIYWQMIYLPYILRKEKADIFFTTDNLTVPLFFKGKTIATIQDLIPIVFSEYTKNKFKSLKYKSKINLLKMKNPEKIMTISNFSKKEIQNVLNISENKIFLIKESIDTRLKHVKSDHDILSNFEINYPYILGIGGMEVRKNNKNLIEAYIKMIQNHPDIKHNLIIVGNKESNILPSTKIDIPSSMEERIHFIGSLTNKELSVIYENAEMLVYPSLYEGFGLPPLEAMKHKIPVITSNITSIPEVVKNAAILINPNKKTEIENAMLKILKDQTIKDKLIKRGENILKEYTWEDSAKKVIEEFNKLKDTINK